MLQYRQGTVKTLEWLSVSVLILTDSVEFLLLCIVISEDYSNITWSQKRHIELDGNG